MTADGKKLKELLEPEELKRSKPGLKESPLKRRFLQQFLVNHCQVVKTLSDLEVSPVELLVWRSEDPLFESLYQHYEKLSNADLAASIRSEAANHGSDLKTKLAVLAALDPEYNIRVAQERAKKQRSGDPFDPNDLSTLPVQHDAEGNVSVRDPIAAVASQVIEGVELDKVVDVEPKVSAMIPLKMPEAEDPIAVLIKDSLETGKGTDFVKYFRPKD